MKSNEGPDPEGNPSTIVPIDYTTYPFLHTEDSERKVREILAVTPPDMRIVSLLDVGCDAGVVTGMVASTMKASTVDALELSPTAIVHAEVQLATFPDHHIEASSIEDFKPSHPYDLIMFIDVLEHLEDPSTALEKASEISTYAIVRSPLEESMLVKLNKSLFGEDIQQIMYQRYGHVHHFTEAQFQKMLEENGFEVIQGSTFRVPLAADIVRRQPNKAIERVAWNVTRSFYPQLIGGFYVAFCKSKNYPVISTETKVALIQALKGEFGEDNLVSVGLFGSTTKHTSRRYSDYDFTIVLKQASDDIDIREAASPRLKAKLREMGINDLCAFNIYTLEELVMADEEDSWLIETMKSGNRILLDTEDTLKSKLSKEKQHIKAISSTAWEGIKGEDSRYFRQVAERHFAAAEVLQSVSINLAEFHRIEGEKGLLIATLYEHGIYDTRDSVADLAKLLFQRVGEDIDELEFQRKVFQQEMEGKLSIYGYENVDIHLRAAQELEGRGLYQEALFHSYSALKCLFLEILHSHDFYIVDGEVTQLFLKEFAKKLPSELLTSLYKFAFKAEQVLGRMGYASFDLDQKGKGIYELNASNRTDLIHSIRAIVEELKGKKDSLINQDVDQDGPKISIVIASWNREQRLLDCLETLNNLIIPQGKIEIVIIDDGSDYIYDTERILSSSKFPVRYIRKEHSGICATKNMGIQESKGEYIAFLDDDMVVSPLWLINLMSGFNNDRVAGVGSTNLTYPDTNWLTRYSDYRELARRAFRDGLGEILNVLTGTACLRRDILLEVGGFNQSQSRQGVAFGGDDVDLTWKIRKAGYKLNHVESAIAFHNHRSNLKSFIKQHIGYGEGTMFHCIEKGRAPADLGIPSPTYRAITLDLLRYATAEVPKRFLECYRNHLGFIKAIQYPLLDFTRRFFYDMGILKSRRFLNITL